MDGTAWILLTGSLVAICCALCGTFLVLKGMTMVGDAISHAVLPGIAVAFLLTGSRSMSVMLIGAGAVGLLASFLIETMHRRARVQQDASIGITFTWLFALGVLLISVFSSNIDLDQDCVLYGEIAYVPLDMLDAGGKLIPRAVVMMTVVLGVITVVFASGWKELTLTTFDPALAAGLGIAPMLWHYVLMSCISMTTVAAFESVGAIIVVALFTAPPAAAYLLTASLGRMTALACVFGIVCAVAGYWIALWIDGSIAGAMAVVAGAEVAAALVISRIRAKRVAMVAERGAEQRVLLE
ncbi:MAG: metal ABC transporter permease [Candidatus Kapabacteria bacterium]|nr:metal ABC transporter permease [Candidatus Kapabacteria bacterium]